MSFPRNSAFSPPAPAEPRKTPEPAPVSVVTSREIVSHADLERWYEIINVLCHPDTRRLSAADWASVPLSTLEDLRDELYSRLR